MSDVTVSVVPTEELGPDLKAQIIEVCVAAHDEQDFRNMFTKYFISGGRHFIAHLDNTLIGHAVVSTRWLQPDGLPELKTAYIDAVAVHPDRQGEGHGMAIMRRLGDEIGDYEIGGLDTDKFHFYERTGWERWRGPLAGRTADGLEPTPEGTQGIMILRLADTPALDLDALLTIERQEFRVW